MVLHEIESAAHSLEQRVFRDNKDVVTPSFSGVVAVRETVVFSASDGTNFPAECQSEGLMAAADPDYRDFHFLDDDF